MFDYIHAPGCLSNMNQSLVLGVGRVGRVFYFESECICPIEDEVVTAGAVVGSV